MASTNRKRNVTNKSKKSKPKKSTSTEQSVNKDTTKTEKNSMFPSTDTAFKAFLSARFCSAIWSHISDCDETFNYWEPSHFLLYGKGFQTWEYSPAYALRSYTYLLLHVVPAWIYANLLQPNRMLIFYFVRCLLGLFCAFCESYFYRAVCKEFGIKIGRLLLMFLIFSPGMFIASTAFLPSSFSMYMCLLSIGAWYDKKYELAIFTTALSTFISWPFAALVGVPIAFDMLFFKKNHLKFFKWSIISTVIILIPMIKMDSDWYGRLVVAPFNIVKYNVLSRHGPNLYGTEPASFYFVNAFLNFNIAFISAISTPILLVIKNYFSSQSRKHIFFRTLLSISPFYLWFLVFVMQPHKEERFLFPVYPLICLCGAISISSLQSICAAIVNNILGKGSQYLANANIVSLSAFLIYAVLGISRILALYRGYHAPMDLYMEFNKMYAEGKIPTNVPINVCVGKEWHRFPTSFFLPSDNWNLKFLESDFKGQLPAEYSQVENSTTIIHSHFNDLNKEERSRYFDVEKCDFLVDCDFGKSSKLEPNYSSQTDKWTIISSMPFLNSEKSNKFFRAFYIPYVSDNYCSFASYNLLQSKKFKLSNDNQSN